MKYFFLVFAVIVLAVIFTLGLRGPEWRRFSKPPIEVFPDMDRQSKFKSQSPTDFFQDGRADRMPVEGSVSFDMPLKNTYFASGKMGDKWGDGMPSEIKLDEAFMARGQERYHINCAVCHGLTGKGDGVTSKYGLVGIADLTQQTFVNMEDGNIFHTITYGKGQMGAYPHISIQDRWAIIAYIRALQRSQSGKPEELPPQLLESLK